MIIYLIPCEYFVYKLKKPYLYTLWELAEEFENWALINCKKNNN